MRLRPACRDAADGRIDALLIETKSGRFAVRGGIFIDCSGDGDLAAWAGAPYEVGDGVGNMLYPSTMFRINGVDPEQAPARAWELIPTLMDEAEKRGPYVPAQEADRAAAAQPDRMARQPHADQESRRLGCQRHRRANNSATARSKDVGNAGTCSSSSAA